MQRVQTLQMLEARRSDTPSAPSQGTSERARIIRSRGATGRAGIVAGVVAVVSAFGLALGARPAAAQVSLQVDRAPDFEWRARVESDFRNEFETQSDAGDEFDSWHLGVAGEYGGPINESILVGFRAGYRYATYDFNLDNGSPTAFGTTALPRDPWNSINTIDLVPTTTVLVGSQFSVVAALPIRWAGESGADRNGFAAGISALVRWQPSDAFSIGAGLGVTSQLEGGAETFPLISLWWRVSPSLDLVTEGGWLQGGRALLLWGPNEAIRLSVSAGYERTRFRLDDNGTAADRNGIGEVRTIPIEVGLRFRLIEDAFLEVHAGLGLEERLRVETDSGHKLYDQTFDPAPRVGFEISVPIGPSRS